MSRASIATARIVRAAIRFFKHLFTSALLPFPRYLPEGLEARTLLSAIVGNVQSTVTPPGTSNAGLANWLVYEDAADAGAYQSGDPVASTDGYGNFSLNIDSVDSGTSVPIGVVPPDGQAGWRGASTNPTTAVTDDGTAYTFKETPPSIGALAVSNDGYGNQNLSWAMGDAFAGLSGLQLDILCSTDDGHTFNVIGSCDAGVGGDIGGYAINPGQDQANQYYITADGSAGFTSTPSNIITAYGPPNPAINLNVTPHGSGELDLSWDDNSNLSPIYIIERSNSTGTGESDETVIGQTAPGADSYLDTSVTGNTTYTYTVVADANGLTSQESSASATTPVDPVNAPTYLAATAVSPTEIDLAWIDNSPGDSCEIDRSTDGVNYTQIANIGAGLSSFQDTTVTPGQAYYYQACSISSEDSSVTSASSNVASATPPPDAPVVSVNSLANAVELTWTDDGGTDFAIERSDDGGSDFYSLADVGSATSFTDSPLPSQSNFVYLVVAGNSDGVAPSAFVPAQTSPAGVEDLTAVGVSTSTIDLSWNNAGPNSAVTVENSCDGGSYWTLATLTSGATSYTATDLGPDQIQYYEVYATDASGNASAASIISAYTLPDAPIITAAGTTGSGPAVTLNWADNNGGTASYDIARSDDGGETFNVIDSVDPGVYTYTDMTTTDGATYQYEIDAVTPDGSETSTSAPSDPVNVPLAAPSDLVATASPIDPEVGLSWTNNSQSATGFEVERSTDPTFPAGETTTFTISDPTQTFYTDDAASGTNAQGVVADTLYYYQVLATGTNNVTGDPIVSSGQNEPARAATCPSYSVSFPVGVPGYTDSSGFLTITTVTDYIATDPVHSWLINWGDGTAETDPGDGNSTFQHQYAPIDLSTDTTAGGGDYVLSATPLDVNGMPLLGGSMNYDISGVHVYAGAFGSPSSFEAQYATVDTVIPVTASFAGIAVPMPSGESTLPQPIGVVASVALNYLGDDVATDGVPCPATLENFTFSDGFVSGTVTTTVGPYALGGPFDVRFCLTDGNGDVAIVAGVHLNVWGVYVGAIGLPSAPVDAVAVRDQILPASTDGTNDLQTVVLEMPGIDSSGGFDVTLTCTDPGDIELFPNDANENPELTAAPVIGGSGGSASYMFSVPADDSAEGASFSYEVLNGSTTYNVLSFSATATVDGQSVFAGPIDKASLISMTFQTPSDANGNPILTNNNPDSPAPGSQAAEDPNPDAPTPPVANLVEVDFVYPTDAPNQQLITFSANTQYIRFWNDDSEDSLALGGANSEIDSGTSAPPTKFFADLYGSLPQTPTYENGVLIPADSAGLVTFTWGNGVVQVSPVGLSATFAGADPGDPDATVPTDSSSASASSDQYATLDLNLPTTGPSYSPVTTLSNGTMVTLTIDSALAQLVDVYDADPTQGPANLIAGVDAGTSSYTWTIGSGSPPPQTVYIDSFGNPFPRDMSAFTLAVTAPPPGSSGGMPNAAPDGGSSGGGSPPATSPATPVAAVAPAAGYGALNTSLGTFAARLRPASSTVTIGATVQKSYLGTNATVEFTPNANFTNAPNHGAGTKIQIVQIAKLEDTYWENGLLWWYVKREYAPWHIDDPDGLENPYYVLPGGNTSYFVEQSPVGYDGQNVQYNGRLATIDDVPGIDQNDTGGVVQVQQWFEDVAVIASGPDKGTLLGALWWGHSLVPSYGLRWLSAAGEVGYTLQGGKYVNIGTHPGDVIAQGGIPRSGIPGGALASAPWLLHAISLPATTPGIPDANFNTKLKAKILKQMRGSP